MSKHQSTLYSIYLYIYQEYDNNQSNIKPHGPLATIIVYCMGKADRLPSCHEAHKSSKSKRVQACKLFDGPNSQTHKHTRYVSSCSRTQRHHAYMCALYIDYLIDQPNRITNATGKGKDQILGQVRLIYLMRYATSMIFHYIDGFGEILIPTKLVVQHPLF